MILTTVIYLCNFFPKYLMVTRNSKLFDFCHYNQVNETIEKENYANKNWAYMPKQFRVNMSVPRAVIINY